MSGLDFTKLAIPGVSLLVSFLSYSSQFLFRSLDPGPLERDQIILFNVLVACLWISYARSCTVNPGRIPSGWTLEASEPAEISTETSFQTRNRFCRKCEALKPPRSHHCKVCKRCIPKMDHHCPWTRNCVSHFTFPHFMRFLIFAVTAMCYLEYFLYLRAAVIWNNRKLPSYLGPSVSQLLHLFILLIVNSLTLFAVGITFVRTVWALGSNVTTIESWEIERHEQLLRRARVLGGYLNGPDGIQVKITRQEFPYDIGIWQNICAGMGTANFLMWLWPFAATPSTGGLTFETNGFEDPGTTWPPPDPDRMPRKNRVEDHSPAFMYNTPGMSAAEEIAAFKQRQQDDIARRSAQYGVMRRKPFHQRFEKESGEPLEDDYIEDEAEVDSGEEGWRDSDGNRLQDYGVDEDVEFYDEDDIPIAQLLQRREQRKQL